jgi:YesN/AraC family two-component response regulator
MSTILVIDDSPVTASTYCGLLRLAGHLVFTAPDGNAGLSIAESCPVDVCLVDLRLPDMTGLEVVSRLKGLSHRPTAVVVTAFPDIDAAYDASAVGAAGFVDGPLFGDELLDVVHQALDGVRPVRHPSRCGVPRVTCHAEDADPTILRVVRAIDQEPGADWSLATVAKLAHLSGSRLRHRFSTKLGIPLSQYVLGRRVDLMARLLLSTATTVADIIERAGLGTDHRRARRAFRQRFGLSPKMYRQHGPR